MDTHRSTKQAAEQLGVSPSRVRAMIDSGEIAAIADGGRWLIPATAIEQHDHTATLDEPGVELVERIIGSKIDELLIVLEPQRVADMLDIPVRRVRDAMRADTLPSVEVGSRRSVVPTVALVRMLVTGQVAA